MLLKFYCFRLQYLNILLMKKLLTLLLFCAFICARSQNTYDLYNCSYPNPVDKDGNIITGNMTGTGYFGEYQIFLEPSQFSPRLGNHWTQSAFQNNPITYKIEVVSFPFTPNCANCMGGHISPPTSTTERKLCKIKPFHTIL